MSAYGSLFNRRQASLASPTGDAHIESKVAELRS
jgi:hypothetical protein